MYASRAAFVLFAPTTCRQQSAISQPFNPQRAVELVPALHLEISVRDKQSLWIAVTAKPPVIMSEGRRLNTQMRVSASDDVLLEEFEIAVVLVDVILFDATPFARNSPGALSATTT